MRSYVYPFPDYDAGEVNIWTRNVDFHDIRLARSIRAPATTSLTRAATSAIVRLRWQTSLAVLCSSMQARRQRDAAAKTCA